MSRRNADDLAAWIRRSLPVGWTLLAQGPLPCPHSQSLDGGFQVETEWPRYAFDLRRPDGIRVVLSISNCLWDREVDDICVCLEQAAWLAVLPVLMPKAMLFVSECQPSEVRAHA